MQQFAEPVTDAKGNAIAGALVTVFNLDGTLAPLFAADGVTSIGNPVTTSHDGIALFCAANGNYRRRVTTRGVTYDIPGHILLNAPTINVKDAPFHARGDGVSDDWAALARADALASVTGARVFAPAGRYLISKTLVLKANWYGEGTENKWAADGRGTIFETLGSGNPARWTDIDGTDPATFAPLIVMGRSDATLSDMTIKCGATRWSAGVFVPCTKRNQLINVDVIGQWSERGLYIDATWSSTNTTLQALHPEIESDTAATEFSARNCFLEGRWAAGVVGTIRTSGTWVWAPGGVSDMVFDNVRFGTNGPSAELLTDGGGFYANAKVSGTGFAQGINFVNCSFRVGAKYTFRADWINRITMVNTYAETVSSWTGAGNPAALFSKTANTGEIVRVNDRHNADIDNNGTIITNGIAFFKDTGIVTHRADGRVFSPNFEGIGKATANANRITSYFNTAGSEGRTSFFYDDGTGLQTLIAHMDAGALRLYNNGLTFDGIDSLGNYSSGTWTPTLRGSTTAGTNAYTLNVGRWRRIGNIVHCSGVMTISGAADTNMAGNMQIAGLPFGVKNDPAAWSGVSFARVLAANLTAGTQLCGQVTPNVNAITLIERSNTGDATLTSAAKFGTNFQVRFNLTYEV